MLLRSYLSLRKGYSRREAKVTTDHHEYQPAVVNDGGAKKAGAEPSGRRECPMMMVSSYNLRDQKRDSDNKLCKGSSKTCYS
jgi:hypothetical protein